MEAQTLRLREVFGEVQGRRGNPTERDVCEATRIAAQADSGFVALREVFSVILLSKKKDIPAGIVSFSKRVLLALRKEEQGAGVMRRVYKFLLSAAECKDRRVRRKALVLLQIVGMEECDTALLSQRLFDRDRGVRKECVRLLRPLQGVHLNQKTSILGLFKDLMRYDPSPEVRREAVKSVSVDASTSPYLVLACEDASVGVRRVFYEDVLAKLNLKDVEREKRMLVLRRAHSEREFDAMSFLSRKCLSEYGAHGVFRLAEDFYDDGVPDALRILLQGHFRAERPAISAIESESLSQAGSYLLLEHLSFVEDEFGRDSLELLPIERFLELLYKRCCESLADKAKVCVAMNMLRMLRFYEIFEERAQKVIKGTVYKVLGKNFVGEIVDEAIALPCVVNDLFFLGTLVKKNIDSEDVLVLSKSIMKNIRPFGELHRAIYKEVLPRHLNRRNAQMVFEIVFFYYLERPEAECLEFLVDNVADTFPMLVDLYLGGNTNELLKTAIFGHLRMGMGGESMAIPVSKIMLFDGNDVFLVELVALYYGTCSDETKQYLTVFFREYFGKFSSVLVSGFCDVFEAVAENRRLWTEQAVYWLQASSTPDTTRFAYNICIYMLRDQKDLHRKALARIFDAVELQSADPKLIKKIIYCCNLLFKRGVGVGSLIEKAMVIDDGEPIDRADVDEIRELAGMHR